MRDLASREREVERREERGGLPTTARERERGERTRKRERERERAPASREGEVERREEGGGHALACDS